MSNAGGYTQTKWYVYNYVIIYILEINKNLKIKKEIGIAIKSKETSSQLPSLEIASYPLYYRKHWPVVYPEILKGSFQ